MTGFDCDGTIPDYVKLYGEFYDPTEFYFNSPGVQFIDQPTVVNLVQKMISGGMTQCAIGDELGVSQTTIKKIARKHKLGNSYPGHKGNIIKLFDKGVRDAKKIASSVGCQPGYVYKVASKLGISLNKKELARRAG
ncbi:hypothetical protein Dalk_4587 [Desulfatibacillum aliphaticivorans]|uniref:Uncharacterized protein n=2 Tax=Desulfatibacillum aliphaticivorans TaxID=218208 RepID=B8FNI4_DESAL|nr:hypothetical protein Dalk_4587 [Desulfatibacillum aliphaticivorans]